MADLDQLQSAIGDHYIIDREIARGGMATVYLAKDKRHDRDVALKVMHREVALALGRERFLREIKLTAKLNHPNILTVHDSGEAGEHLWYVMPYVEGETLRELIARKGRLEVDEAVRYAKETADAIGYAHSLGIVHRDLKPENILLSRGHAVVADFGIARAMESAKDDSITGTGIALGTTAYMSPEQALGEEVDAASDVWALGCVLYEMLSGAPPFGAGGREVVTRALTGNPKPLREIRSDLPPNLDVIVGKAIARHKSARFANGTELASALEHDQYRPRQKSRNTAYTALAIVAASLVITLIASRDDSDKIPTMRRAGLSSDSLAREFYRQAKFQAARRTGDGWAQGIALYSRAIERDSSFALAWAELARTAAFAHARASGVPGISSDSLIIIAERSSEKALILAPDDPLSWLVKSRVSRLMDPTNNAPRLFQLRKALALDSMYGAAWFELGVTLHEYLADSAARDAWFRAARLEPSNTEALSFLGLHYLWTGEYQKGILWADSAVNLDPTYALARDATGQLNIELGRLDQARKEYEVQARVTKGREQGNSFAMLSKVHARMGNMSEARRYLDLAWNAIDSVKPNRHEAAYMASTLAALGDTVAAVRFLEKASPRDDVHFQLHLKRDPGLSWLKRGWGKQLLQPDPKL